MPNDSSVRRHRLLLALYLLFVVYGSLVPLHYQWRPWDDAWRAFQSIPFLDLGIGSRADWIANLLLFIPLTMLSGLQMRSGAGPMRRLLQMAWVWPLAVMLAVGIEFTQLYFPGRTVSQNDILAEALGGLLGAAAYVLLGPLLHAWLRRFDIAASSASRVERLLQAYVLILLGFSVLPLDLTLSPVELYHKWAGGRLTMLPFSGLHGSAAEIVYELATDVLIWVPVGVLWRWSGVMSIAQLCWRTLAVAAAIEFLQLFVFSRVSDTTDILLGVVGAFVGAWIADRVRASHAALAPQQGRSLARIGLLVWLAVVLFTFLFPFDFDGARWSMVALHDLLTRPPLTTYYMRSEFGATNELLRKMGFFLPCGILLRLALPGRAWRWLWWLPLGVGLLIESIQLGMPGKVADLTDATLNLLGAWQGWSLSQWVLGAAPAASAGAAAAAQARRPAADALPTPRKRHRSVTAPAPDGALSLPQLAGMALALSAFLFLALQSSRLPYNLRELLPDGIGGVASALSLGACIALMAALPQWLYQPAQRRWQLLLPLTLLLHAALCFTLLWAAVPMESLYDILGAPVLGGPAVLELLLRYIALHAALMLQVLGAMLVVRVIGGIARVEQLLYWLLTSLLLAWPLHYVVVEAAATDNLVELMSGGGSFAASSLLAGGIFGMALCASSLAGAIRLRQRRLALMTLALACVPVASVLFWNGCEQLILKYGKVFSAWQFLLSSDRERYATGAELWLRYALAFGAVVGMLALLQLLNWRASRQEARQTGNSRSATAPRA